MTKQIEQGKAFEYACLLCLYEELRHTQSVTIVENESHHIAKRYYDGVSDEKRLSLDQASSAALRAILRLEPRLKHPDGNEPLVISLQEDAKGDLQN